MIAETKEHLKIKTAVNCHCINPMRQNYVHRGILTDYTQSYISIELKTAYPPGTILVIRPIESVTSDCDKSFFSVFKTYFLGVVRKIEMLGDEWNPKYRLLLYSLHLETPTIF